jgi:hypothetical protein
MSLCVAAFSVFAALESILWLTLFNACVAVLMLINYVVLRMTPVVQVDGECLVFNRKLLERKHLPLAGLQTIDEDDRQFVLRWRDGAVLTISKRHLVAADVPRLASRLDRVTSSGLPAE